jgi:hypothetical protein
MPAFAVTIFLSAFLFFWVQPLLGRFILPWFGGVPAVWSTCLLFFQTILLAGYAWAHCLLRIRSIGIQVALQLSLCAVAALSLPLIPDASWKPADGSPARNISLLLISVAGLPCLALATTASLLQAWFARCWPERSPYRLYALSNIGSLLALGLSTLWFDTQFARETQARIWAGGYAVYGLAILIAGFITANQAGTSPEETSPADEGANPGRWLWLALPFCSSVLLLAITAKLTQDYAVVPFLWTLPLGLYLLTFVLAFDHPRWYPRRFCAGGLVVVLILIWVLLFFSRLKGNPGFGMPLLVHLGVLGFGCLFCHGELYRLRPPAKRLSGFYLAIAGGGFLGGLFVTIGAPRLFRSHAELPLGLLLCATLGAAVYLRENRPQVKLPDTIRATGYLIGGVLVYALAWVAYLASNQLGQIAADRNFFGVCHILERGKRTPDKHRFLMMHGSTLHGLQYRSEERQREATTYFSPSGGLGLTWSALAESPNLKIGAIGLGTGTLASHGRPGDSIRFYEINPLVRSFADSHFSFLTDSAADITHTIGDARIQLEREQSQAFDLLVIDAFNGGTIPVHLLTREAFALWKSHLQPTGLIVIHVTNRHLDLQSVVESGARSINYRARLYSERISQKQSKETGRNSSDWCVLAPGESFFDRAAFGDHGTALRRSDPPLIWTDERASLIPVLK